MKIVQLNAENVKKLRAVEIKPTGEIVTVAGKNGAGKTSVMDSIWWALAGTSHIQAQPIRKGEKKARIRLDLGELIVERRFTESGNSSLIVENAAGARFPSPQKMLDALIGALSFDPLAFSRMPARQQFDELRRVAELDVDFDQLDGLNRSDFAKRTDVNRDAKAKRTQAEAIRVPASLPEAAINEDALLNELQQAGVTNTRLEQRKANREQVARDVESLKADAARRREKAADLRRQADEEDALAKAHDDEAAALRQKLDTAETLPDPVNVEDLRAKLDAAKETNRQISERERRAVLVKEAEALEARSRELTEKIAAREKEKADAIARAKMPVPGLGFGDGIVTFNGVPLEQASTAEQLRVSLSIAMAANPKLRVIRIQDGSLLDDDSLAAIADMAKAGDYQVWIERVDTSGKLGVYIEDGAVVAVDGAPVPQQGESEEAAA